MKIGIFDSGVGGLNVLKKLVEVHPEHSYIFYGDHKNSPYGEKSDLELQSVASDVVKKLTDKGCRMIVVACNTATVKVGERLVEKYPDVAFVGVTPSVKRACASGSKNILALATRATANSKILRETISDSKRDGQSVYLEACPGLAEAVDSSDVEKIDTIAAKVYKKYCDKEIDCIVLGCTHYYDRNVREKLNIYFPGAKLIDSLDCVLKDFEKQMKTRFDLDKKDKNSGRVEVIFSDA